MHKVKFYYNLRGRAIYTANEEKILREDMKHNPQEWEEFAET